MNLEVKTYHRSHVLVKLDSRVVHNGREVLLTLEVAPLGVKLRIARPENLVGIYAAQKTLA